MSLYEPEGLEVLDDSLVQGLGFEPPKLPIVSLRSYLHCNPLETDYGSLNFTVPLGYELESTGGH